MREFDAYQGPSRARSQRWWITRDPNVWSRAGLAETAEPKTLRYRLLAVPARLIRHARYLILKIPKGWAGAQDLATAWDRLQALHPG